MSLTRRGLAKAAAGALAATQISEQDLARTQFGSYGEKLNQAEAQSIYPRTATVGEIRQKLLAQKQDMENILSSDLEDNYEIIELRRSQNLYLPQVNALKSVSPINKCRIAWDREVKAKKEKIRESYKFSLRHLAEQILGLK